MTDFPLPPAISRQLAALEPLAPGRRRRILAMLGNRVTWGAVRHWVHGRARTPHWVREHIERELERRRAALQSLSERPKEKGTS